LIQKVIETPNKKSRKRYLHFFYNLLSKMEDSDINNSTTLIQCHQYYYLFSSVIQYIIDDDLFSMLRFDFSHIILLISLLCLIDLLTFVIMILQVILIASDNQVFQKINKLYYV
jgi:hypothetical protein